MMTRQNVAADAGPAHQPDQGDQQPARGPIEWKTPKNAARDWFDNTPSLKTFYKAIRSGELKAAGTASVGICSCASRGATNG